MASSISSSCLRMLTTCALTLAGGSLYTIKQKSACREPDWYKFCAAVLSPNCLIHFVPSSADNIGILNPSSSSFSTLNISSFISSSNKFYGGVLGPNGLICFVPVNANNIGILNPFSSSFSTLDIFSFIFSNYKYSGGVLDRS